MNQGEFLLSLRTRFFVYGASLSRSDLRCVLYSCAERWVHGLSGSAGDLAINSPNVPPTNKMGCTAWPVYIQLRNHGHSVWSEIKAYWSGRGKWIWLPLFNPISYMAGSVSMLKHTLFKIELEQHVFHSGNLLPVIIINAGWNHPRSVYYIAIGQQISELFTEDRLGHMVTFRSRGRYNSKKYSR